MLKTLLAASALSLSFAAAPAFAAYDGPLPFEKWDNNVRSMFFTPENSLRANAEITAQWQTLTPEQQAAIRADCSNFPEPGSDDLTNLSTKSGNPVPGVDIQAEACKFVRTM